MKKFILMLCILVAVLFVVKGIFANVGVNLEGVSTGDSSNTNCLLIDGSTNYLLIDGSANKLIIDGAS